MDESVKSVTLTWEPPGALLAARPDMSGLDYLREVAAGKLTAPPITQVLGITVTEADPGRVRFELHPAEFMTNHLGVIAGGMLTMTLDVALGCAALAAIPPDSDIISLSLNVDFLKAVRLSDGPLTADARCVHVGQTRALSTGTLTVASGAVCAHATANTLVRKKNSGKARSTEGQRH